jgi:hypothetical protein
MGAARAAPMFHYVATPSLPEKGGPLGANQLPEALPGPANHTEPCSVWFM